MKMNEIEVSLNNGEICLNQYTDELGDQIIVITKEQALFVADWITQAAKACEA